MEERTRRTCKACREARACHSHIVKACVILSITAVLVLFVSVSTLDGTLLTGRMHPPRGRTVAPTSSVANRSLLRTAKATLKQYVRSVGLSPVVYPIINIPTVKSVLSTLPVSRALYGSKWDRKHPYDRAHGTDTSGFLCGEDLLTGHPAEEHGSPYAGAQPSVIRAGISQVPDLESCTFIDLGCGKGRPMLVASEFPFRDIIGVELSPPLAEVAQRNADLIAAKFPRRTRIRVHEGDATAFPMPAGNVLLFIYNSFDRELMQKVVESVETAIKADPSRAIYVVYCNPASGACVDESPLLTRRFAQMIPYTQEEKDHAEDTEDGIIVWQGGNAPAPATRADARIVVVKERWRAVLA
jgi:SAM-dependent methyltransferase